MTHPDTKPEALRLADALDAQVEIGGGDLQEVEFAADELRRLHAECESLRTQLQEQALQSLSTMGQDDATIAELRAQLAEARAEAERLTDVLSWNGFRRCDIMHCNCGSWHYQGPYRQRLEEFREAIEGADIDLNGKTILAGAQEVIAQRDADRAEAEALRADARRHAEALNMARICAESHHKRADDCGDLARKLLTALNAIDTAMGAKEA